MKIGTVIFFNDGPDLLEACLKSLKSQVDYILTVDGPYAEFPHNKDYSTDGCIDVAREYSDCFIQGRVWPSQVDKRNITLIGMDGSYYLSLDTDEVFMGSLRGLNKDAYRLKMEVVNQRSSICANVTSRLFKHQPGIEYRHQHSLLWVGNKLITPHHNESLPVYEHGELIHYRTKRPEARYLDKAVYYKTRKENNDYSILKEKLFKENGECQLLAV